MYCQNSKGIAFIIGKLYVPVYFFFLQICRLFRYYIKFKFVYTKIDTIA